MTTLNLDTMETGQLIRISKNEGLPNLYQRYAASKYNAINLRLQGRIDKAQICENFCDSIYDQMPTEIKW